ncbi:MAG: hypothetical protein IJ297_07475 [Clostridia bacterium]|nr:hypothetical protein [Clostridia bacterium]
MSDKATLQKKYDQSRASIAILIVFTIVNIALLFTDADIMFLFSFTIPYWSAIFGYLFEAYAFYAISAAFLLILAVCWFFSKKHFAWFIPALVLFCLDTAYLVYVTIDLGEGANVTDIIIHIYAFYCLISGIYYGYKLRSTPKDKDTASLPSSPLRLAEDVKHRVLLETDYQGYHICYRRVKGTNELVVNGYVYDEYKKIVEFPHTLTARFEDAVITSGYDNSQSFITVNGVEIARKTRIV